MAFMDSLNIQSLFKTIDTVTSCLFQVRKHASIEHLPLSSMCWNFDFDFESTSVQFFIACCFRPSVTVPYLKLINLTLNTEPRCRCSIIYDVFNFIPGQPEVLMKDNKAFLLFLLGAPQCNEVHLVLQTVRNCNIL